MTDALKITGLTELKTVYRDLPDNLKRRTLRRAARQAANVFLKDARRRAPLRTSPIRGKYKRPPGTLRKSLIVKSARELNTGTTIGFIVTALRGKAYQATGKKATNKDAFYARWVHEGHRIVARGKSIANRGRKSGLAARRRGATGARVEGRPFFAETFAATSAQAFNRFAEILRADLLKPDFFK